MADKFESLFEEARNSGLPEDWVDRFQTTFEASGLRKDNLTVKEENRLLREQTTKLQAGLLRDRFTKLGITANPDYVKVPDDLDPANEDGVKEWAVKAGLLTAKPTTEPEIRATHDRIAAATNEGNVPSVPVIDPNMSEEAFWAAAQAREQALNSKIST